MSTHRMRHALDPSELDQIIEDIDDAIEDIDDAIDALESEGVFRAGLSDAEEEEHDEERQSIARQELDEEEIADHTAELENKLNIVADLLTHLIEPEADEALSIGEILARYVRDRVVDQESVATADKLLECLGSTGSVPGDQGLRIGQTISYDSLQQLVEDLRALANHLNPE
ncbi:MAG TPA: hypothetical protein VNM90_03420 [Haliangium sp.]|nr:hypothetical protein [Haliangium sp.]